NYEGLRRIADTFPDITFSPLIILVDQFEEVYTYTFSLEKTEREAFIAERDAFIENLLCAAAERSQRVSVILTLRSDFLGDTQQHPRLNKLFSTQGFLVPIMQPEELEIAIAKPAEQAGHKLDKAIVTLLVEQTQGREGTLPLLQFALTRIWEGLQNGVDPAETLHNIGGVGGALAGEAQRLYQSLSAEDQAIARCIFLALVQLNEDSGDTRRRAAVSELIASDGDEARVWSIINRFAEPRVRFLVLFSDKQYGEMIEMIEVAHEALIRNWKQLKDWLKECREALRKKRKIEDAAEEWKYQKKSKDYLLQGRSLRDAREFMQAAKKETALSSLAAEFVKAGVQQQRSNILKLASGFLVFPLIGTLITVHLQIISRANLILYRDDCKQDSEIKGLLEYMWWTKNANRLRDLKLCKENMRGIKLPEVVITTSDFKNANLSNIDFHKATILNSNFRGATIAYTNFSDALLAESDFQCSDTECTILLGANFQNAKLQKAKLQNAVLVNANFRGADLTNANLDGAEGLTTEQLETAILCHTIIPKYITISGTRDCSDELP
ncbi:MAG TPA: pentapeptide repeat-containing protein, partial [Phormidium sp.]